jgi:hypothetical protein
MGFDRQPFVLRRTLFAKMFFQLLTVLDLGEMNGRLLLVAVVAFHRGTLFLPKW